MTVQAVLRFKRPTLEDEFHRADRRLQVVAYYAGAWSVQNLDRKPLIVTRIESGRSEVEGFYGPGSKPSVHEVRPCRGLDARTRGYYTNTEAWQLVSAVNAAFEYRAEGLGINAALHETIEVQKRLGRLNPSVENEHIHFQVPPIPPDVEAHVRLWWPA